MAAINLTRGFNRVFLLAVLGWAIFCLLIYPVLMAREGKAHYDGDVKYCYDMQAKFGSTAEPCLSQALKEFHSGTYSGFGFAWDEGEYWSFNGYYRHMGWMLPAMIAVPPILRYGLAWGVAGVCRWVWRGFRPV
jgi:hypothetical protein